MTNYAIKSYCSQYLKIIVVALIKNSFENFDNNFTIDHFNYT